MYSLCNSKKEFFFSFNENLSPKGLTGEYAGGKILQFSKDCYFMRPNLVTIINFKDALLDTIESYRTFYENEYKGSTDRLIKIVKSLVVCVVNEQGEITQIMDDNIKNLKNSFKDVESNVDKMTKKDIAAKKKGVLLGRYLKFLLSDGYVFYEIVEEAGDAVKISHIKGLYSEQCLPKFGESAVLSKKVAKENIEKREKLSKLFSK